MRDHTALYKREGLGVGVVGCRRPGYAVSDVHLIQLVQGGVCCSCPGAACCHLLWVGPAPPPLSLSASETLQPGLSCTLGRRRRGGGGGGGGSGGGGEEEEEEDDMKGDDLGTCTCMCVWTGFEEGRVLD